MASATWFSKSARFSVAASKAVSWRVASDWTMKWAGLTDVNVVSSKERIINGDIFESCLELDAETMTHAWSYDRVPAAWGIGLTPSLRGRIAVFNGATADASVIEYTMSAAAPAKADVAGMLDHEVASVGPKLVAYIEAHKND
jgi:hypothetical protein